MGQPRHMPCLLYFTNHPGPFAHCLESNHRSGGKHAQESTKQNTIVFHPNMRSFLTGLVDRSKYRIFFVSVAPKKTLHFAVPPFLPYTTYFGGAAALSSNHLIALSRIWGEAHFIFMNMQRFESKIEFLFGERASL